MTALCRHEIQAFGVLQEPIRFVSSCKLLLPWNGPLLIWLCCPAHMPAAAADHVLHQNHSVEGLQFLEGLGLNLSTIVRLGGHSYPRTHSNPVGEHGRCLRLLSAAAAAAEEVVRDLHVAYNMLYVLRWCVICQQLNTAMHA